MGNKQSQEEQAAKKRSKKIGFQLKKEGRNPGVKLLLLGTGQFHYLLVVPRNCLLVPPLTIR